MLYNKLPVIVAILGTVFNATAVGFEPPGMLDLVQVIYRCVGDQLLSVVISF